MRRAAAPCARSRTSSGAKASLSGSSTKTCQPSESIVWCALRTFVPSSSSPTIAASAAPAGPSSAAANLRERREARVPPDEVVVRMRDEHTVASRPRRRSPRFRHGRARFPA